MSTLLPFSPVQTNYASDLATNINIHVPLDGGPGRKRSDLLYSGHLVECTWLLKDQLEYDYFMGLFRTTFKNGSRSFLIDLITDIGIPTRHTARNIGGPPKLIRQSGDGYWVQATLQAVENPTVTGNISYGQASAPNWIFDGVDDQVQFGNIYSKERTTAFSVGVWFKTTSAADRKMVSKVLGTGTNRGWQLYMNTGRVFFQILNNGPTLNLVQRSTTSLYNTNVFRFALVTWDGNGTSNSGIRIYVDGAIVPTSVSGASITGTSVSAAKFQIGGFDQVAGTSFPGTLQHAQVWNKQLSAAEVLEAYGGGTPPDLTSTSMAASLEGWWKIDGSDTTGIAGVLDRSGNSVHGTAVNGLGDPVGIPGNINYPNVNFGFAEGDTIQTIFTRGRHANGNVLIDLDGVYTIDSIVGTDNIILSDPSSVKSSWSILNALGNYDDVVSTVTRVPT